MLIYEVNLDVDADIAETFYAWLEAHVRDVLALPGFTGAQIFGRDAENDEDNRSFLTVHYSLKDRAAFDDYLFNHAPAFRQDGIDKFGGKFTASRRILNPNIKF